MHDRSEQDPGARAALIGGRRLQPISDYFGFDRGTPIDRYYIERFLQQHAADIRGRVLEVKSDAYTRAYGGSAVTQVDVLDIDAGNPAATLVADLQQPEQFPPDAFDCFILTQTLHLVFDVQAALASAVRTLRPGGVLLLTAPAISQLDAWTRKIGGGEYWRFTSDALDRLLRQQFRDGDVTVTAAGNVLVACAFLQGLCVEELAREELEHHDPHYETVVLARAVKARE